MQDLKHLTTKKGFFTTKKPLPDNRRKVVGENLAKTLRPPSGKKRQRLKHLLLFLAIVLALAPICTLTLRTAPKAIAAISNQVKTRFQSPAKPAEPSPSPASDFAIASRLLDSATDSGDNLIARTQTGETIYYTVQSDLQKRVHDFMADNRVPYGVFVAIEPATGRILAMTAHSSVDPAWSTGAFFDLYPMASLFKIVTASAALEQKRITPETVIEFRGKFTSENPRYWEASPRGKNNRMDLTYAMGKSINPVYGRVAADIAGKTSLLESVRKFGFNQPLFPGTPIKESRAAEPQDTHSLMRMGAGLDHEVKISPLHAAVMMAAIANGGKMMSPGLTEKVISADGTPKGMHTPREIRQLVSPETASSLTRMLSSTVTSGTSRKAFHDRRGRPRLDLDIAAKTGSINGTDPRGHYSWFAAFAPAREPRVALVALVINQDKWKVKASQVGETALRGFLGK